MPRLSPAPADALAQAQPLLDQAADVMGFTPNSLKIMARSPAMLQGFMALSFALMGPNAKLDPQLRQMIANITSAAAGCNYCQAHTAHGAERLGLSAEKIEALWTYETSEHFTPIWQRMRISKRWHLISAKTKLQRLSGLFRISAF